MQPGLKPMPLAVHRANGNPSKLNIDAREKREPRPADGPILPPERLKGRALEAWNETLSKLEPMGVITTADVALVARYCELTEAYEHSISEVQASGVVAVKPQSGRQSAAPAIAVARGLAQDLSQIEADLGLNPSARARMTVDNGETAGSIRKWLDAHPQ